MKKKKVIRNLQTALDHCNELIKASKKEPSNCGVRKFEDLEIYVQTWIKSYIYLALEEIEVKKI